MRFVRENHQMTNKKLYCEDVLQMLFADSDSEGEYLQFGNDDRPSNDRASPGTSLPHIGAAGHGKRVHKAQTSDNFVPLPYGDGGGRGGRGLRVNPISLSYPFPYPFILPLAIVPRNRVVNARGENIPL